MTERIELRREELFTAEVDEAIARTERLRRREFVEPPPVSPLRRLLMSNLFYLPLAGLLGGIAAWMIIEPYFDDFPIVGGTVVLINSDPLDIEFETEAGAAISLTVGAKEVVVIPGLTRLEVGLDGQAALEDLADIAPGAIVEAVGERLDHNRIVALAVRPATPERAEAAGQDIQSEVTAAHYLYFPLAAVMIALALMLAEGVSNRNWIRTLERSMLGVLLTAVFSFLAYIPVGFFGLVGDVILEGVPAMSLVGDFTPTQFVLFAATRSAMWACLGAGLGVGMNLARSTRRQLRNSVIGGALGGALGGLFFDPIDRFVAVQSAFAGAELSRMVGSAAVGISVGVFVALVDRLAREAWVQVKTGPLTGKSFVLYRTPTTIGSAPEADIYLFKDAGIAPIHAEIHRVGNRYEIDALESRGGTTVGGEPIRRHRLVSGDQIFVSNTLLEFEERSKHRTPYS